jgi:leader peptidase (prepilin peptidase) / N-methyltransferase
MILADVPPWLIRATAIVFGLLVGSFLNVVIARVPRDESIVSPPSHCVCGKPIAAYDNIPIVSWLILRGRARCCGAPISVRYPTVEAIGGVITWAIIEVHVLAAHPASPILPLLARAFIDVTLALALVAAAFIDLDHMFLPDAITIGGAVIALASAPLRPELGWARSAIGLMVGFWIIYLPFIVLYRVIRGRQGMGMGDAKLLALAGAWLGWKGAVFTLFAGAIQGVLATIVVLARKGKIEEPAAVVAEREEAAAAGEPLDPEEDPVALPPEPGLGGARVPFGPFLILAALEFLLFGQTLVQRWMQWVVED